MVMWCVYINIYITYDTPTAYKAYPFLDLGNASQNIAKVTMSLHSPGMQGRATYWTCN